MNDAICRSNAISRSAALSMMDEYIDMAQDDEMHHAMCVVAEGLAELPVLDVAPVVRCKDCIHAVAITNLTIANRCGLEQKNCMRQRGDDGFGFAGVSVVYPDGFCDEGARMDAESEEDA